MQESKRKEGSFWVEPKARKEVQSMDRSIDAMYVFINDMKRGGFETRDVVNAMKKLQVAWDVLQDAIDDAEPGRY